MRVQRGKRRSQQQLAGAGVRRNGTEEDGGNSDVVCERYDSITQSEDNREKRARWTRRCYAEEMSRPH